MLLDTYLAGSDLIGISLSLLSRALLLPCEIGTVICCDFPLSLFYPHCSCTVNRKAESSLPCTLQPVNPSLEVGNKQPIAKLDVDWKCGPSQAGAVRKKCLICFLFSYSRVWGIIVDCREGATCLLLNNIKNVLTHVSVCVLPASVSCHM